MTTVTVQALEQLALIEQEIRTRKVNHGRSDSPTLIAWADRIKAELTTLSQQLAAGEGEETCPHCGAPCRKEVLLRGGDYGWGDDASRTVYRYTAAVAAPGGVDAKPCKWEQEDWESDCWVTSCGHAFSINNGAPSDNSMKHCCYCAGLISEQRYVDPNEDDEKERAP